MKKIIFIAFSIGILSVNAQRVKLQPGGKITITTKSTIVSEKPAEMGGGENKIESTTTGIINITGENKESYLGTFTGVRMISLNGDGVGFDSDKKKDRESDFGKMMASNINKAIDITVNKEDGSTSEKENKNAEPFVKEEDDNNGHKKSTQNHSIKMTENIYENAFFIIPNEKKTGDKWIVDKSEGGMEIIKKFELKSITENIATIDFSSLRKGTYTNENNGIQMETFIDSKGKGTILVNRKTTLVKKITSSTEVDGTMEIMGRSIPISKNITSETIFE